MKRHIFLWVLIVIIASSMIGCGSNKSTETASVADQVNSDGYNGVQTTSKKEIGTRDLKGDASPEEPSSAGELKGAPTQNQSLANNANIGQKVIFTGQVNYQTLDFNKTRTSLLEYVTSIGGYAQNSSVQGGGIGYNGLMKAEYLFRIPKTKYMQAFIDLRQFGTVVFEQSSGEDVTDKYFDTEARLKSLKIQQERLQALLQKADKMEDILKIEKELQTTLYEIENYTGTLKKWDSLVEYSTLMVNISEVEQIKPVIPKEKNGFLARIAYGFKNSVIGLWEFLQDFIVFIAAALPVIIPLSLIGYLIYRVMRKRMRKSETVKKSDS